MSWTRTAVACVAVTAVMAARVAGQPTTAALAEAQRLNERGFEAFEATEYEQAREHFERALALRERILPPEHPDIATSLLNLAMMYRALGEPERARPLEERALSVTAQRMNDRGREAYEAAEYEQAREHFERSLALRERILLPEHPDIATSLNNLAATFVALGQPERALPLEERALAVYEQVLPPEHPFIADVLNNLAETFRAIGQPERALLLHERALTLRERVLPPEHPGIAESLNNLGLTYFDIGQHARALLLHERALNLRERVLLPEHPGIAESLNNLATTFVELGQPERALSLQERALALFERAGPSGDPRIATALNNLAAMHLALGEPARALPLLERAVTLREQVLPDHPHIATALNNLAATYRAIGQPARALPLLERALALHERGLPPDHPDIAVSLNNLALTYAALREPDRALSFHERTLALHERVLAPDHHHIATSVNNLANAYRILGQPERALPLHERALTLLRTRIASAQPDASGHRPHEDAYARSAQSTMRLALEHAPARGLAVAAALDQDGRLETDRALHAAVAARPALRQRREALLALQQEHQAALRDVPDDEVRRAAWRARVEELSREVDDAYRALLDAVPEARAVSLPLRDLERAIRRALPAEAALIALVPTPPPSGQTGGAWSYTALVVTRDAEPALVPLGEMRALDGAAEAYRATLDGTQTGNYYVQAEALYDQLFAPLREALGGRKRLYVLPDGPLDAVPLVALGRDRRFLLDEGYEVRQLGSAVELLRPPPSADVVPAEPLVMAPFTGSGVENALEAAAREAEHVATLLGVDARLGPVDAQAALLRRAVSPRILHLATHGEFEREPAAQRESAFLPSLARSMLLFPPVPGLGTVEQTHARQLTAYEVTGLDLRGTRLVVLSACNSAQGTAQRGHSARGLRRAFLLAGAETVVASLWRVDDGTTEAFMVDYLQRVLRGEPRGRALHAAMRAVRACNPNPRYWAPFVLLGETDAMSRRAPWRSSAVDDRDVDNRDVSLVDASSRHVRSYRPSTSRCSTRSTSAPCRRRSRTRSWRWKRHRIRTRRAIDSSRCSAQPCAFWAAWPSLRGSRWARGPVKTTTIRGGSSSGCVVSR